MKAALLRDGRQALHLLLGVERMSLRDDVAQRHAVRKQVITAYPTFSSAGVVIGAPTQSHNLWRDAMLV